MVRHSVRKNARTLTVKNTTVYNMGASCIVLAPEDRISLATFFSILMNVEKRNKGTKAQQSTQDNLNSKNLPKIKGSLISGPLFLNIIMHLLCYLHAKVLKWSHILYIA